VMLRRAFDILVVGKRVAVVFPPVVGIREDELPGVAVHPPVLVYTVSAVVASNPTAICS
jgi:hypothetical protein